MRLSVFNSAELQAVILLMKSLDRETAKQIRRVTKTTVAPVWSRAVAEQASTRLEVRVLASTARTAISDQNVTLSAATVGRPLSGGLSGKADWHAIEFGAKPVEQNVTATRNGRQYRYRRTGNKQFRSRNPKGFVFYPAASQTIPRILALWTQTVVREFAETLESR